MPSRPPRRSRVAVMALGAILILMLGILIGGHPSWLPGPLRSAFVDPGGSRVLDEALNVLAKDYYRPIDRTALVDNSLAGAVASLNDPFSHYFDASHYRSYVNQTDRHLSGVGIDVQPVRLGLRVRDVFPGSPAARAGLTSGELIVAVGSISLVNRSPTFGSRLIKGPVGTRVTLVVLRGRLRRRITMIRAEILAPVVTSSVVAVRGAKVGVVSFSSFTDGSGQEVRAQVKAVLHQGARALVLDLRANGGGLLEEAVNVASIFIPDGTIVSTSGRNQPRQVYVARGGAIPASIPLVVLVDQGTASSAEIVTGALRDRGRAKVIGTRTFGKGVFQTLQALSDGGALEIVTGRWFEPSGRNVGGPGVTEGAGIRPDIYATTGPRDPGDRALGVAELTVAAEVR